MGSYQTILLCYDGSREGRKALRQGADLARVLGAQTHLLAVLDTRTQIAHSAGLLTDLACSQFEASAQEVLAEGVASLKARGLQATGHFAHGLPVDEIAALAKDLNADLVIVGHRCRRGLSRWWGGNGNANLLDRLSCSLLVACSSVEEQKTAEILNEDTAALSVEPVSALS